MTSEGSLSRIDAQHDGASSRQQEVLATTCRHWIALWNAPADWMAFDALHTDDFVDHAPAGRSPDKVGFAAGLAELHAAFPDLRIAIDDLVIDARRAKVAIRWHAHGTNRRTFLGTGPTHLATRITGIEIVTLREGRVAERWGEWDISAHQDSGGRCSTTA